MLQDEVKATLIIEKTEERKMRVSGRVGNRLNCEVKINDDGSVSGGPVMMTRMMPPPELQSLERDLANILETLAHMKQEGEEQIQGVR